MGKFDVYACACVCTQFFVVVFVIEAILKLTALGAAQYFRDEWNTFDFIVTALGVIELSVENVQGLSVLRAFRLVSGCALLSISIYVVVCMCFFFYSVFAMAFFAYSVDVSAA